MKRILALLLTLTLLAGLLAACAPEETPQDITGTQPSTEATEPSEPSEPEYKEITIAEALTLCGDPGNITEERYYIRGIITSIDNATYGAMTIEDETGSIPVYGTYSTDGSIGYANMTEKPYKGDEVLLHCILQNYNGTKEVKNARLIEFKVNEVQIDLSQYQDMTIAQARAAEIGKLVKVDGVVARITYANGMIPSGVVLVDETNSIYVYDGDLAQRVQIGNRITIAAEKTYWILDDEQSNAAKFGYKGCNQLDSAVLIENDGKTDNVFDTAWVTETTVKELLDTPVSQDITTTLYKVNALVHKQPGSGFVNYYFNDLDGKTGSYTYTQCNGSDFAWLDEFDGKICTVYLMAINAKSTATDCFFRFLPVAVKYENFDVSTVNVAEHAVKYYGVGQFLSSYTGDPALELITSVSSDLLKFQNAKLSYVSEDDKVISFKTAGDKVIMNCHKSGTVKVSVIGSYNGKTYREDVQITVTVTEQAVTYPTVADAIAKNVGDTVQIKGIVGPSLVNKSGFYLIDDTGVIAVLMDADALATLKIGNEVVLEGVRHINTKGGTGYYGQTCLKDATVIVNNYGSHNYSTASFDGDITVADFYNLDVTKDFTTSVYTMKATVVLEESQYYTSIFLSDGTTKVRLYCSNANQYSWLKAYAGQEVTVEIAPCNWNDKNYYVGCVLSVVTDSGKVLNELNFKK